MREFRVCEAHGGIRHAGQAGEVSAVREEPRRSRRRAAAVEGRSPPAPFDLMRLRLYQAGQRTDANEIGEGLADARVDAVGAANSAPQYLGLSLNPKVARAGRRPLRGGLRYRRMDRDGPGFLHAPG